MSISPIQPPSRSSCQLRIALCRGTGFVASAIKWQTRSQYSHAGLLFSDDTFIHATWPKVQKVSGVPQDYDYDLFLIPCTPTQEAAIREFAERQVGKPYDLTMVIRFVTRQQETRKSKGAWFCSEFVFAAVLQGGIVLLANIDPWAVSPEILSLSPIPIRINGGRFDERLAARVRASVVNPDPIREIHTLGLYVPNYAIAQ